MALKSDKTSERSKLEEIERKKYGIEFGAAMALYVVTIIGLVTLVDEDSSAAKYWVLIAAIPFVLGAVVCYRAFQRYDEYTQLLQLKGLALAFAVAIFGVFLLGMVGIVGYTPAWGPWAIFMTSMTTWGMTTGILVTRDSK